MTCTAIRLRQIASSVSWVVQCPSPRSSHQTITGTENKKTQKEEHMTSIHRENRSFFKDLISLLTGHLVLPGDVTYDQVRQLWNGKVNKHPAALVRCADAQDVVHTVSWARSHGLALSVRAGGHDFAGRALCDDGVVIDCSQMRAVVVDAVGRTARVQGGATIGDLIDRKSTR